MSDTRTQHKYQNKGFRIFEIKTHMAIFVIEFESHITTCIVKRNPSVNRQSLYSDETYKVNRMRQLTRALPYYP